MEGQISFKNRLVQIYTELDKVDIKEIQVEIDELKKEVNDLILQCQEAEEAKEKVLTANEIKKDSVYQPIPPGESVTKPIIVKLGKDDKETSTVKDIITIGALLSVILVATICIAFL